MSHTVFFTDVTYPFTGPDGRQQAQRQKKFDDVILVHVMSSTTPFGSWV